MSDKPAACRDCGASIFFADTPGGGKMPLDLAPHPRGCVVLDATGCVGPRQAGDIPDLTVRYLPHWATCKEKH